LTLPIRIALIGNPNVGKTSLFNAMTGSKQHVGNWPGVTVEKKTGNRAHKNTSLEITDLPGTYSLVARSPDEEVATRFLFDERPDVIVQVVDATNIERNLYLTTQLIETGIRMVIALNMSDEMEKNGDVFDEKRFEELWGIPVVRTSANIGAGVEDLLDLLVRERSVDPKVLSFGQEIDSMIERMNAVLALDTNIDMGRGRQISIGLIEGDRYFKQLVAGSGVHDRIDDELSRMDLEEAEMSLVDRRYEIIVETLAEVFTQGRGHRSFSDMLDRVVTNRYLGIPIFLAIIWGIFQVTFTAAAPFSSMIDLGFQSLAEAVRSNVQPAWLASLIGDGVIGGVGFVMIFVPNIVIMFLMLSLLEDSGYLARAAFIMDRLMSKIGLHGKSFIPMLLGFGCNLPAIMATRTIEDRKSRLITILTIPFMSCSARLPVFILFAGAFFSQNAGTVVFGMYVLGIVVAILSAKLFRMTILKGESESFIMELPPYRLPTGRGTAVHIWDRSSAYVRKAGTIILLGAVIVWCLASLPWGVEYGSGASYAGTLGHMLEPLVAPLGFDWRIAVALLFGFVAKEIVVGSLGVLYGTSDEGLGASIRQTGGLEASSALGLMAFVLIYTPCLATIGVIKKETGSWKWTAFSIIYGLALAWVMAFIIYHLGEVFL
jgi:ferrous iron transport protein B